MTSLENSTKHKGKNMYQFSNSSKRLKGWGGMFEVIMGSHHPDAKTRQRHHQNRKLQAAVSDEYTYKSSQQNIVK